MPVPSAISRHGASFRGSSTLLGANCTCTRSPGCSALRNELHRPSWRRPSFSRTGVAYRSSNASWFPVELSLAIE